MSEPFATAYTHLAATRYLQVAATCLLAFDYFLTFGKEVELFWTEAVQRVTWRHVLFFTNRYFSLFAHFLNTGALLNASVTDRLYVFRFSVSEKKTDPIFLISSSCFVWVHYLITGFGAFEIFVVQAILIARLHVMYLGNRALTWSLLVMWIACSTSAVAVLAVSVRHSQVTAHPAPNLTVCASVTPAVHIWAFWVPVITFETVLFGLAMNKTVSFLYQNPLRGRSSAIKLIELIMRDSIAYFFIVLALYTTNIFIWRYAAADLLDVFHGMTIALIASVGNRMMINLREAIVRDTMTVTVNSFGKAGLEFVNVSSSEVVHTNNNERQSDSSMPVIAA